jgi:hypothetical protein
VEPRDRAHEAARADWSAGARVEKSNVTATIISGEETVTLDTSDSRRLPRIASIGRRVMATPSLARAAASRF